MSTPIAPPNTGTLLDVAHIHTVNAVVMWGGLMSAEATLKEAKLAQQALNAAIAHLEAHTGD